MTSIYYPDQAHSVAHEMADQCRDKHLEAIAAAELPSPYPSTDQPPPSRRDKLMNQFLEEHYPDRAQRPLLNPFQALLNQKEPNQVVSADQWETAARELATTLIKSGERVGPPPQSPPSVAPKPQKPKIQFVRHRHTKTPAQQPTAKPKATPPQPPSQLTEANPSLLELSQYSGRFEWDDDQGCYIEK